MQVKGKKSAGGRHKDCIAFPREEGPVGFWVQALDEEWDVFNERCPAPTPPVHTTADGKVEDEEDEGYEAQVKNWGELKMDFLTVYSLTIEDNQIDWDNVILEKPSTWRHWRTEVKEFGLSRVEVNKLFFKVLEVNSLSEDLMEQARADFLRGPQTA